MHVKVKGDTYYSLIFFIFLDQENITDDLERLRENVCESVYDSVAVSQ